MHRMIGMKTIVRLARLRRRRETIAVAQGCFMVG